MVAFRKSALLAMSVLLLGAGSAFAQTTPTGFQPLQCTANSGVPPVVRAEGLTELVGDLVLTCTGGNPDAPFLANFQLFLNTQITSRLVGSNLSEALLMVDEPGLPRNDNAGGVGTPTPFCLAGEGQNSAGFTTSPQVPVAGEPACNTRTTNAGQTFQRGTYTVFRANRIQDVGGTNNQAFQTALQWPGVPVQPPGSNRQRIFRFTNIRANANGLNVSQTFFPTPITAFVSVSPQGTLPIDQPQQTVGVVQQGLVFDVRNCSNSDSISIGIDQCVSASSNRDFFSNPNRESGTLPAFGLFRFREGFPTAFKPQILPGQESANPGVVFNSESGFVRTTAVPTGSASLGAVGIADSGTRLSVRFQNVPANTNIFVSTRNVYAQSQTAGGVTTRINDAVFVTTDPNGATLSGGVIRTPTAPFGVGSTTIACGSESSALVQVPIVAGAGTATWEVIAANPSANEEFLFFFGLGYTSANPSTGTNQQIGLGTGQVIGNLAPFYAATGSAVQMAGFGLPIPRFASRTDANNFVRVQACQTNLLFPFVTNRVGFDTGIAIANTSEDTGVFSDPQNRRQSGRCRLNYFGRLANGNAPSPASETTDREVASGETITMVLSSGGDAGLRGSATFQGYIIAQCDFRFAHGFAFITDGPVGQARVAEGYLALVLDGGPSDVRLRGQATGEVRGH